MFKFCGSVFGFKTVETFKTILCNSVQDFPTPIE